MLSFSIWWNNLGGLEQLFWSGAIVCSILLIIRSILSLSGNEFYGDKTENSSQSSILLNYFNSSNLLSFLTFSLWTAIIAQNFGASLTLAILIGVVLSATAVAALTYFVRGNTKKLKLEVDEVINHPAKVQFSIPPHRIGHGKVQVEVRGATLAIDAITEGNALPIGAPVMVIDVINERTLLVEAVQKNR